MLAPAHSDISIHTMRHGRNHPNFYKTGARYNGLKSTISTSNVHLARWLTVSIMFLHIYSRPASTVTDKQQYVRIGSSSTYIWPSTVRSNTRLGIRLFRHFNCIHVELSTALSIQQLNIRSWATAPLKHPVESPGVHLAKIKGLMVFGPSTVYKQRNGGPRRKR